MAEPSTEDPKQRRRSERLYLTIPIRVFATDPNGRDICEDTLTVVVSRHGGRVRVQNQLVVDDEIYITNLTNNKEARFRVVGRVGEPRPDNPFTDWGVECLEPEKAIWGLEFKDSPEDALAAAALLECCGCGLVASVQLTDEELDTLGASQLITRPCTRCRQATLWKYAAPDRRKEVEVPPMEKALAVAGVPEPSSPPPAQETRPQPPVAAPAPAAPPGVERRSGEDRRQEHRLALRVPIRVRAPDGAVEVSKTENLSKSGGCFLSEKQYPVGTTLFVVVPYTPGEEPIEAKAVVDNVEELPGSSVYKYGIGVKFEAAKPRW